MQPTNEADRLLQIAEKLLEEKDLNAARDFALLAQETEPLLDGSDQIMAIADVLIAGDKRINDIHHHWYAILQIDIHRADDLEFVKQQYRRLALLLHSDKNKFSLSESAFKLVGDAWSVLSDPETKAAYDNEFFEFFNVDLDAVKNQREKDVQIHREKMLVRRNSVSVSDRMPPERYSQLGDLLPNVSAVEGTPLESRSTMQPPENTAPEGV
ncbi:hypothetical protein R6Q59_036489 [Mikania micrantha]